MYPAVAPTYSDASRTIKDLVQFSAINNTIHRRAIQTLCAGPYLALGTALLHLVHFNP